MRTGESSPGGPMSAETDEYAEEREGLLNCRSLLSRPSFGRIFIVLLATGLVFAFVLGASVTQIRKPTGSSGTVTNPGNAFDDQEAFESDTFATVTEPNSDPVATWSSWNTTDKLTYYQLDLVVTLNTSGFGDDQWGLFYDAGSDTACTTGDNALASANTSNLVTQNLSATLPAGQNLSRLEVCVTGSKSGGPDTGREVHVIDIRTEGVNDPDAPLWRNVGQEKDTMAQGDNNTLSAEGQDGDSGLDYAQIATNESGTWQNKTVYGFYDRATRTCTQIWGFDCSTSPDTESDNTFDSCSSGGGSFESVNGVDINVSKVPAGEPVKVTCDFDTAGDGSNNFYVWYYDGDQWYNIFQETGNSETGSSVIRTATFTANTTYGQHRARCGIAYQCQDTDQCTDCATEHDNDDVNITVKHPVEFDGETTYQWANVTWKNDSLLSGSRIFWKLWFADNAGNVNDTDTQQFDILPLPGATDIRLYRDAAYSEPSRFFGQQAETLPDTVYANITLTTDAGSGMAGASINGTAKQVGGTEWHSIEPWTDAGSGFYNASFSVFGWNAGVYNLTINATKNGESAIDWTYLHVYPGTGVSAYTLDYGAQEERVDSVLENEHLVAVFNGTSTANPLAFVYQKDRNRSYTFGASSDGRPSSGAGMSSSVLSSTPLHNPRNLSTTGESLSSADYRFAAGNPVSNLTWWNASWSTKRRVHVSTTRNMSGYQIEFTVPYTSSMQSDFGDLRFTQYNRTSGREEAVPYYVENKTDGDAATVLVRVPELTTVDMPPVYMYYGEATATTRSNRTQTYDLYDDFEDYSTNDPEEKGIWNITLGYDTDKLSSTSASASITGGELELSTTTDGEWAAANTYDRLRFGRLEMQVRGATGGNEYSSIGQGYANLSIDGSTPSLNTDYLELYLDGFSDEQRFSSANNSTSVTTDISTEYSYDTWYNVTMISHGSGCLYYQDGQLLGNHSDAANCPFNRRRVRFIAQSYAPTLDPHIEVEWVSLRKEIRPKPTVTLGDPTAHVNANVTARLRSSSADFLTYHLSNIQSRVNTTFISLTGTLGNSVWDDRYHLQNGTDRNITTLPTDTWRNYTTTATNYSAVYDNASAPDAADALTVGLVPFNASIPLLDLGLRNDSNQVHGLRSQYNITDADRFSDVWFLLPFTKGNFSVVDQWMSNIQSGTQPSPNFFTAPGAAGSLTVTLTEPPDPSTVIEHHNYTIAAEVTCQDGSCGWINATARYNTTAFPDQAIPEGSGTPFYITASNPQACTNNPLSANDQCTVTWNVTASQPDGEWKVDTLFESNRSGVTAVSSDNATVNVIEEPPVFTDTHFNATDVPRNTAVRLNTTITDDDGLVSAAVATLRFPNGSTQNRTLSNASNEWYADIVAVEQGVYNLTTLHANDSTDAWNSTAYTDVTATAWLETTLDETRSNLSSPVEGQPVELSAHLINATGLSLQGQNITFLRWNGTTVTLGFAQTNATGWAVFDWDTSAAPVDSYTINATYDRNTTLYTERSFNDSLSVTVSAQPQNATVRTYATDAFTTTDRFFARNQTVNVEVNVTDRDGNPVTSGTGQASFVVDGTIRNTTTVTYNTSGLYHASWTTNATQQPGVYTVNATVNKGGFSVERNDTFHLYPGDKVSAYRLDWDHDGTRDAVLENQRIITVINTTVYTEELLSYVENKEANASYTFGPMSDPNSYGRGEITTNNLKGIDFYSFSLTQTGEFLDRSSADLKLNLIDPPQTRSTIFNLTHPLFSFAETRFNDSTTQKQVYDNTTFYVRFPGNTTLTASTLNVSAPKTTQFTTSAPADFRGSISFGDVDGDGHDEVSWTDYDAEGGGGNQNEVWVFDCDGPSCSPIFSVDENSNIESGTLGDVDDDGEAELVYVTKSDSIYVYDCTDSSCSQTFSDSRTTSAGITGIGDINNDGVNEFAVAGTANGGTHIYTWNGTHYRYNLTTNDLMGSCASGGTQAGGVDIANIDSDATGELLVAGLCESSPRGPFVAWDCDLPGGTCTEQWRQTTGDAGRSWGVKGGDVDGDGKAEFLAAVMNSGALDAYGDRMTVWDCDTGGCSKKTSIGTSSGTSDDVQSVTAGDVDADGIEELIWGTITSGNLFVHDCDADDCTEKWNMSMGGAVGSLDIGDTDPDDTLEIGTLNDPGEGNLIDWSYVKNPAIDGGATGTDDYSKQGVIEFWENVTGFHPGGTTFLDGCPSDDCGTPFNLTVTDNTSIELSQLNVTYDYNASSIFNLTFTWNQTTNIEVGRQYEHVQNISYTTLPPNNLTVEYIDAAEGATTARFNGSACTLTTVDGNQVCDVPDFTINTTGPLPAATTYWDDTLYDIPATQSAAFHTVEDQRIFVWNVTVDADEGLQNITTNYTIDETRVRGETFLNVSWAGTWYDITPPTGTGDCDTANPTYTALDRGGDTFFVCKEDADGSGVTEFYRWKQPHASTTRYQAGGEGVDINVSLALNDATADYIVYRLSQFDDNVSSYDNLYSPITGSVGASHHDDRYHIGTTDAQVTSLGTDAWSNLLPAEPHYVAIYDNVTDADATDNLTIAWVRWAQSSNIVFEDLGAWNDSQGSGGARIRWNVSNASVTDSMEYTLQFARGDYSAVTTGAVTPSIIEPYREDGAGIGQTFPLNISLTGKGLAQNCDAVAYLPSGLSLVSGPNTKGLGNLSYGGTNRTTWMVRSEEAGTHTITVGGRCDDGVVANTSRAVTVSPVSIRREYSRVGDGWRAGTNGLVQVRLVLHNNASSTVEDISVTETVDQALLDDGGRIATVWDGGGETGNRISWDQVQLTPGQIRTYAYILNLPADGTYNLSSNATYTGATGPAREAQRLRAGGSHVGFELDFDASTSAETSPSAIGPGIERETWYNTTQTFKYILYNTADRNLSGQVNASLRIPASCRPPTGIESFNAETGANSSNASYQEGVITWTNVTVSDEPLGVNGSAAFEFDLACDAHRPLTFRANAYNGSMNNTGFLFGRTVRPVLGITRTNPDRVATGSVFSTSLTLRNNGTADSFVTELIDRFPSTFTVTDPDGGSVSSYNATHDQIEWTFRTELEPTQTLNRRYRLQAPSTAGTHNLRTVWNYQDRFGEWFNRSDPYTIETVSNVATIDFTITPSQVNASDNVTVEIQAENPTGHEAINTSVNISMPAGWTAPRSLTTTKGLTSFGSTIEWNLTLNASTNETITFFTNASTEAGENVFPVQATFFSNGEQLTDTEDLPITVNAPQIVVTRKLPGTVGVDTSFASTLTFDNQGNSLAYNLSATERVCQNKPASCTINDTARAWTVKGAEPDSRGCDGDSCTYLWNGEGVNATYYNTTQVVNVTVTNVSVSEELNLTYRPSITEVGGYRLYLDGVYEDTWMNTYSLETEYVVTVAIRPFLDFSLTPLTDNVQHETVYTWRVKNTGTENANESHMFLEIPPGFGVVQGSISPSKGLAAEKPGLIEWNISGIIPEDGGTETLTVNLTTPVDRGSYILRANASYQGATQGGTYTGSEDFDSIIQQPDIVLSRTMSSQVDVNETFTVSIQLTNDGTLEYSTDAVTDNLTEDLASTFTLDCSTVDGGGFFNTTCDNTTTYNVTWTNATLGPGDSTTVSYTLTSTQPGTYFFNASNEFRDPVGNHFTTTSNVTLDVNDLTTPTFFNVADDVSGTIDEGTPINTEVYWRDNYQLDTGILRTNASGTWQNVSTTTLTGTADWYNATIDTKGDGGERLCWTQWANDTTGNLNGTMDTGTHCVNVQAVYRFNFTMHNASREPFDGANISYVNATGSLLGFKVLSPTTRFFNLSVTSFINHDVRTRAPVFGSFFKAVVTTLNATGPIQRDQMLIPNHTDTVPGVDTVQAAYAFNASGLDYRNVKMSFPTYTAAPNVILHCTDWNYTNANCTGNAWEKNASTDYNPTENATHITFTADVFDAYATAEDLTPPQITIHEPPNATISGTVFLNVTADEQVDTWRYEVDSNGTNITFAPNTTLGTFQAGSHNVTVYANDTVGNTNGTTRFFTIEPPERDLAQTLTYLPLSDRTFTGALALAQGVTTGSLFGRLFTGTRTLAADITMEQVLARTRALLRDTTQPLAYTEAFPRTFTGTRLLTQPVRLTDTVLRTFTGTRSVSDAFTVTDTSSRIRALLRDAAETFTVETGLTRTFTGARTLDTAVRLAAATERTFVGTRSLTVTAGVTAELVKTRSLDRARTTLITLTDTLTRTFQGTRLVGETVRLTTVRGHVLSLSPTLQQTFSVTTAASRSFTGIRTLASLYTYTETTLGARSVLRSTTQALTYTTSVARTFLGTRITEDTFAVSDSTVLTRFSARTTTVSLSVAAEVFRTFTGTRVLATTYAYVEVFEQGRSVTKTIADQVTTGDTFTRVFAGTRALDSVATLSTRITRASALTRVLADTYDYGSLEAGARAVTKTITDTVTATDTFLRTFAGGRTATAVIGLAADETGATVLTRSLVQPYQYTASVLRTFAGSRTFVAAYDYTTALAVNAVTAQTFTDTYRATAVFTRTFTGSRVTTTIIDVLSATTRTFDGSRSLTQSLAATTGITSNEFVAKIAGQTYGYVDTATRTFAGTRLVLDAAGYADTLLRGTGMDRTLTAVYRVIIGQDRIRSLQRSDTGRYGIGSVIARTAFNTRILPLTVTAVDRTTITAVLERTESLRVTIPATITRVFIGDRILAEPLRLDTARDTQRIVEKTLLQSYRYTTRIVRESVLGRLLVQPILTVDTLTRRLTLTRRFTTGVEALDAVTAEDFIAKLTAQTYGYIATTDRRFTGDRTATDRFTATTFLTRTLVLGRTTGTAITVGDTTSAFQVISTLTTQTVGIVDSVTRRLVLTRVLRDDVLFNDVPAFEGAIDAVLTETLTYASGTGRVFVGSRGIASSITTLLDATRQAARTTSFIEAFRFVTETARSSVGARVAADTFDTFFTPLRTFLGDRRFGQTIRTVTGQDGRRQVARTTVTGLTYASDTVRTFAGERLITQPLTVLDTVVTRSRLGRLVSTGYGYTGAITADDFILKRVTETFEAASSLSRTTLYTRIVGQAFRFSDILALILPGGGGGAGGGGGGTGGGGGGTGGGGGGFVLPEPGIRLETEEIIVKIRPGESSQVPVGFTNNGTGAGEYVVRVAGVERFFAPDRVIRTLDAGEETTIGYGVSIPEGTDAGVYRGLIRVSVGEKNRSIPATVIVQSVERDELDIQLSLANETFVAGRGGTYTIDIFNVGQNQSIRLLLNSTIRDSNGSIQATSRENLTVRNAVSLEKRISTALGIGNYTLNVSAAYSNRTASAAERFRIIPGPEQEEVPLLEAEILGVQVRTWLSVLAGLLTILVLLGGIIAGYRRYGDRLRRESGPRTDGYEYRPEEKSKGRCEYCGKRFSSATVRRIHENKHRIREAGAAAAMAAAGGGGTDRSREASEDRPEAAGTEQSAEESRQRVQVDEEHVCSECGKTFGSERTLNIHRNLHHSGG